MNSKIAVLLVVLAVLPLAAQAQNESVTVTGKAVDETRQDVMRGFVKSYVTPSRMLGKIARWDDPICPATIGLSPEANAAVSAHVRKIAETVGARVESRMPCRPNITIIFAPDPQELMTEIAAFPVKYKSLIGDVDGPSHARQLAKIRYPVQAWYGTEVEDAWGARTPSEACWPSPCYVVTNGSRISNGQKSVFTSVLIVVDLKTVVGREVGTMGDYVAMLALSQTKAFSECRALPSITNLLTPGCGDELKAMAASEADLAYLRGVYKMDPSAKFNMAGSDISNEMVKSPDVKTPAR